MCFEDKVEEMMVNADAKEIHEFLSYYHELEPCCVGLEANECAFARLRDKMNKLKESNL